MEGQLSHISDLHEILRIKCDGDPLSKVNPRYCKPLEQAWKNSILNASNCSQETGEITQGEYLNLRVLMPAMKQFITQYLIDTESQISEKESIKKSLRWCEVNGEYLGEQLWFDLWPDEVPMSSAFEAYKLLERISGSSE